MNVRKDRVQQCPEMIALQSNRRWWGRNCESHHHDGYGDQAPSATLNVRDTLPHTGDTRRCVRADQAVWSLDIIRQRAPGWLAP